MLGSNFKTEEMDSAHKLNPLAESITARLYGDAVKRRQKNLANISQPYYKTATPWSLNVSDLRSDESMKVLKVIAEREPRKQWVFTPFR